MEGCSAAQARGLQGGKPRAFATAESVRAVRFCERRGFGSIAVFSAVPGNCPLLLMASGTSGHGSSGARVSQHNATIMRRGSWAVPASPNA